MSSLINGVVSAAGAGGEKVYVEDVFSTYLYSGNNNDTRIPNGITLSTTAEWSAYYNSTNALSTYEPLKRDSSGNYYALFTNTIVKYNSSFTIVWQRAVDMDTVNDFNIDTSGNVFVVGNKSISSIVNAMVCKYNSSGAILWTRKATDDNGGSFGATMNHIVIDSVGSVYVYGHRYRSFQPSGQSKLHKFDTNGNTIWAKTIYGPSGNDNETSPLTLAIDSSNNIYVASRIYLLDQFNNTRYAGVLTKYDSSGNILNRIQFGAYNYPSFNVFTPNSIAIDSSGNVFISGYGFDVSGNSLGAALSKLNSSFTHQWTKCIQKASSSNWEGRGITIDGSDNIYLSATNYSRGAIIKYDNSGSILWQRGFDKPVSGVALDGSGNVYATTGSYTIVKIKQDGTNTNGILGDVAMYVSGYTTENYTVGQVGYNQTAADGGLTFTSHTASDSAGSIQPFTTVTQPEVIEADGLVWIKSRSTANTNALFDTKRGASSGFLTSNDTSIPNASPNSDMSGFTPSGFVVNNGTGNVNVSGRTYASWTFRKQKKFFDVITYTGNGTSQTIAHNLGSTPGMIIVKRTDNVGNWIVWHRSLNQQSGYIFIGGGQAETNIEYWNNTAPTSSVFSVGPNSGTNANGGTYVAYLFADSNSGGFGDAGTDSVVACGSFTGDGTVTLGWEPQFILFKRTDTTGNWRIIDNMRGMPAIDASTGSQQVLFPNTSGAEATDGVASPTATGFNTFLGAGTYIYLAIRRGPMKVPTSGTSVFLPSTTPASTLFSTGITSLDAAFIVNTTMSGGARSFFSRLTSSLGLDPTSTSAQANYGTAISWDLNNQFRQSAIGSAVQWLFRRAPGFFDVVCWRGSITANFQTQTISHNLGSVPTLLILKNRTRAASTYAWATYVESLGNDKGLVLNTNISSLGVSWWGSTTPNATTFTVAGYQSGPDIGPISTTAGDAYVAYLFATCPGVSKVGSYTGTGTTNQINCGFTNGARFVLIKRTDSTGDWYTWDSARGIIAGNDPYLLLNSTAAEVTNTDYIDPYSPGFELSSTAPAALNANGGTYIFLAIA